jgi:RNA polymerase sigma-70 factor (ECF subfamily)
MSKNKKTKVFLSAYDKFADQIFRYCYFRIRDREIARDIVQDVFVKTWAYQKEDREIDNMKAFLFRTAHNCIVDNLRKKKEVSLDNLMEKGFDKETDAHKKIFSTVEFGHITSRMNKMDDKYKEAVLMRYVDGLKPKEISAIIGETENVISVRIHRGIEQLKKLNNG